jgi:hypothetical protein
LKKNLIEIEAEFFASHSFFFGLQVGVKKVHRRLIFVGLFEQNHNYQENEFVLKLE